MKRRNEESREDPKRQKPDYEQDEIQIDEHGTNLPNDDIAIAISGGAHEGHNDDEVRAQADDVEDVSQFAEHEPSSDDVAIDTVDVFIEVAKQRPDLMAYYFVESPEMQELTNAIVAALQPADEL
jgi:hypothetical protein